MQKERKSEPRSLRFDKADEEMFLLLAEKEERTIVNMIQVLVKRGIAKTMEMENEYKGGR